MRRRRRLLAVAASLCWLAVAVAPGQAGAARSAEVSYAGTGCREIVAAFSVPAYRALAELPPGWELSLAEGRQALVGVAVLRCKTLTVDGTAVRRPLISDVGIQVRSPEDRSASAWYQLWQHTSARVVRAAMGRLGVDGRLARLRLAPAAEAPLTLDGEVRAPGGDYGISVTAAPAGLDADDSNPVWWHDGPRGRVRLEYAITETRVAAGPARLWADPGSRLAGIAGGTETPALGLSLTMDFEATAHLLPKP